MKHLIIGAIFMIALLLKLSIKKKPASLPTLKFAEPTIPPAIDLLHKFRDLIPMEEEPTVQKRTRTHVKEEDVLGEVPVEYKLVLADGTVQYMSIEEYADVHIVVIGDDEDDVLDGEFYEIDDNTEYGSIGYRSQPDKKVIYVISCTPIMKIRKLVKTKLVTVEYTPKNYAALKAEEYDKYSSIEERLIRHRRKPAGGCIAIQVKAKKNHNGNRCGCLNNERKASKLKAYNKQKDERSGRIARHNMNRYNGLLKKEFLNSDPDFARSVEKALARA